MLHSKEDYLSDTFALQFPDKYRPKRNGTKTNDPTGNAKNKTWVRRHDNSADREFAPIITWNPETLHPFMDTLSPYNRKLVTSFIDKGYPQETISVALKQDFNAKRVIGATFEGLAHLALTDAITQNPEMFPGVSLLDTITTSGIFDNLVQNNGFLKIDPDGAIIRPGNVPELKSLIEYKINAFTSPGLNRQITKMSYFLQKFKGEELPLPNRNHRSDNTHFNSIKIGCDANILIVTPQNSFNPQLPPDTATRLSLLHVPFNSSLAVSLGASIFSNSHVQK